MDSFIIDKIHLHMFKKHEDLELECDTITEIFGRNASGKSSIADAISFALTGFGFWGQKLVSPVNGCGLAWVELRGKADGVSKTFRRLISDDGEKVTNKISEKFTIDKELFFTVVNPRYLVSMSPASAKEILLKVSNYTTGMIPILYPNVDSKFDEMFGEDEEPLSKRAKAVDSLKKELSAQTKELDEKIAQAQGKLTSLTDAREFFTSNNIGISSDIETSFDMFEAAAVQQEVNLKNEKKDLQGRIKELDGYKATLLKAAVHDISSHLSHVSIQAEDGDKDVFIVRYDGKDYKTLSNAEQLFSGLELVNAILEMAEVSFPCIIDNAESVNNLNPDDYANISQFLVLSVADVDLSVYNAGTLTDIKTLKTMKRTKEMLKPSIRLLGGWDNKGPDD